MIFTYWLFAAAFTFLLLGLTAMGIVLAVRSGKRKRTEIMAPLYVEDRLPGEPAASVPGGTGARVIAVNGTLNGKRFSVNGTVRIGRDALQCAIAFPGRTRGVSAVHCELSFNGSVCYIRDLNSSYGTFTADGRRLDPATPVLLRSGDRFYLASPKNTFEVRI